MHLFCVLLSQKLPISALRCQDDQARFYLCLPVLCQFIFLPSGKYTAKSSKTMVNFVYLPKYIFFITRSIEDILEVVKNILKTIVTVSGKDDKECVNQFISVPQWDQCADRVPRVFSGPSDNRSKLIKKDPFPFVQFNRDLWIVITVQSNFAAQIWNLIQIFKMKLLFQRICAPPHSPIDINVHGRRGKKVRDCEFLYVYSWKFQCRN